MKRVVCRPWVGDGLFQRVGLPRNKHGRPVPLPQRRVLSIHADTRTPHLPILLLAHTCHVDTWHLCPITCDGRRSRLHASDCKHHRHKHSISPVAQARVLWAQMLWDLFIEQILLEQLWALLITGNTARSKHSWVTTHSPRDTRGKGLQAGCEEQAPLPHPREHSLCPQGARPARPHALGR